jgi:hypothetical protein
MKPSCPRGRGRLALLVPGPVILLVVVLGCRGQPPAPADPERAREVLRRALDAWQKGDMPETLKQRAPSVVVIDPEWGGGARLLAYRLESDGLLGAELRCQVMLSVQKNGKTIQKNAVYNVGTSRVLTVVREEEQ